MAKRTSNSNLYLWEAEDQKIVTFQEYNKTYEFIDAKLASTDAQLVDVETELAKKRDTFTKITNADLDSSVDSNKVKLINLSDEVKQAMAGTTPINATVENLGVVYEKYARKSISPEHTNFLSIGKNLYDVNKATAGSYINYANGGLLANANYYYSDYIPIKGNTVYSYTNPGVTAHFAFYDKDKAYISTTFGNTLPNPFTSPANAAYFRFSINKGSIAVAQLEEGSTVTSLEQFKYLFTSYVDILGGIADKSIKLAKLEDLVARYVSSKNIFNKNAVTTGYFVDWNGGGLIANTNYSASDYIPVKPNTTYVVNVASHMAEYNSSKVFVSGRQSTTYTNTFTTGANTYYVRISPLNMNKDTFQVEEGTTPTSYVEFGLIPATSVNGVPVFGPSSNPITNWSGAIWSQLGDSVTQQGMWQSYVASKFSLNSKNNGIGGTKVADTTGSDTQAMCRDERINALDANSKLITFMGGINDWAQNVPLGTISDTGTDTFYGALITVAKKLTTRFPTARIVFMTPTFGKMPNRAGWSDTYGLINNLGLNTGDYGRAMIEVARLYGIPCIDTYGNAGWNDVNILNYVTDDGAQVHPNAEGGKRMASLVIGKLKEIEPVSS